MKSILKWVVGIVLLLMIAISAYVAWDRLGGNYDKRTMEVYIVISCGYVRIVHDVPCDSDEIIEQFPQAVKRCYDLHGKNYDDSLYAACLKREGVISY